MNATRSFGLNTVATTNGDSRYTDSLAVVPQRWVGQATDTAGLPYVQPTHDIASETDRPQTHHDVDSPNLVPADACFRLDADTMALLVNAALYRLMGVPKKYVGLSMSVALQALPLTSLAPGVWNIRYLQVGGTDAIDTHGLC